MQCKARSLTIIDYGAPPVIERLQPPSPIFLLRLQSLSSGAKGEVYEVTGDQDLEHDPESQAEDRFAAVQALCEILPSFEPVIVFFPDSSEWLSKTVPKSSQKEFVQKLEEMLNKITGPVVLVCGQNVVESAPKEKEKFTMVLPQLGRIACLPLSLKRLTEGLRDTKSSRTDNIWKLFTNVLYLPVPKEEEHMRTFNNQIEEDKKIIVSRENLEFFSETIINKWKITEPI